MALGTILACASAAPATAQELEKVADGLSNPRGLAFGPGGKLYVAEAGRGGSGACIEGPEGDTSCYGATGAITRVNVRSGATRRIVTGLPSLAAQTGETPGADTTGPHDVSFRGRKGYFTVGLGADPALREQLGAAGPRFAGLYRIRRNGRVRRVADLGATALSPQLPRRTPGAHVLPMGRSIGEGLRFVRSRPSRRARPWPR